jgi:hypothetical protein
MGGSAFCITICDPATSSDNQTAYCQNIYDRMGCSYNMPNKAQNGTFEVCEADLKIPAGLYVTGGVTMTYSQPASASVDPPYTPVVPSSSNCVTYNSAVLYSAIASVTPTGQSSAASATGTVKSSTGTGSSGAASPTQSGGAVALGVSTVAGIAGTLFAVLFLS